REQRGEHVAVVLTRDGEIHEADLALVEQVAVAGIGRDHHELRAVERDVALDERGRSLADRAEAHHHDRARGTGAELVHVTVLRDARLARVVVTRRAAAVHSTATLQRAWRAPAWAACARSR